MSKMKPLRLCTIAVILALPVVAVGGCESVERDSGVRKEAQIGAGAGAAAGGIIAAIAGANPAWIAASAVLGGVTGGAIGQYITKEEAEQHAQSQYTALDSLQAGQTRRWSNPETGHRGSTTVTNVVRLADGTVCKDFVEVIETDRRAFKETGSACKRPGNHWEIRKA